MLGTPVESTYSTPVAVSFALNVVLGTGPLTLAVSFQEAGWALSVVFLSILALIAWITASWILEAAATANGLAPGRAWGSAWRLEVGELAQRFLPRWGAAATYITMIAYTFGVLAVYAVSVSMSLADLAPSQHGHPKEILGMSAYNVVLIIFALVVVPSSFGNFQSTRHLQVVMLVVRVAVFCTMLAAAAKLIGTAEAPAWSDIPQWRWSGVLSDKGLLGNCVLTVMIHHSIPGLLSPVRPESGQRLTVAITYLSAVLGYALLGGTALAAFTQIDDLYNENFENEDPSWLGTALLCYPITMVSLYPLISITLRNNLRAFVGLVSGASAATADAEMGYPASAAVGGVHPASLNTQSSTLHTHLLGDAELGSSGRVLPADVPVSKQAATFSKSNVVYTLAAAVPPLVIAAITHHVQVVSSITGAYAGLGIMLVIPAVLAIASRAARATAVAERLHGSTPGSPVPARASPARKSPLLEPAMGPVHGTAALDLGTGHAGLTPQLDVDFTLRSPVTWRWAPHCVLVIAVVVASANTVRLAMQ